ncbi:MAG TPA: hypothetical protein VGQ83_36015 [Polyangia bacterium]|jgi:hypothetical protein
MRRLAVSAVVLAFAACGGRAGPGGWDDPGGGGADAGARDGAPPADAGLTGRPCSFDGGCATGYTCTLQAPGGYCLYGAPYACGKDRPCPAGTACSPLPRSQISGVCLLACAHAGDCRQGYACDYVELFPGEPNSPRSDAPVCWGAAVCQPGMDQTCNDNPLISSTHGKCLADGTCMCLAGSALNPATGRCK